MKMIGGIYKVSEDYALSDGRNLYFLFDGICDIKADVEIDSNAGKLVEGYCLSIDKMNKKWKIRDTGHKGCKDILVEGTYIGNFYESLKPILKIFSKG